ncbi:unnamed protein product [Sordaria macrospora k-hell]|uniref:WGS project CABT00000000 data, contig 2.6 n=1 Tax=Sordaria macrospora (strain ATCC MYA-333 / DSM 997 / K(L3346) / K-hell) TaxID=771870 RepID=F7VSJ4_SORMK|nr:uncharacterized protein SMAC_06013 [Sordaria macrospora k-hell]KAH7626750.1 hypothetical protein B0T09DRAFT_271705 [Sordaria sp. MPI-SDFR-AT-0083]CCC08661.1 unnamed protein product [Sordaria macrospora k-hell]
MDTEREASGERDAAEGNTGGLSPGAGLKRARGPIWSGSGLTDPGVVPAVSDPHPHRTRIRIGLPNSGSSGVGQKPKEQRQRVLISAQYERKIDHFGTRLTGIEKMLRELMVISQSRTPSSESSSHAAGTHSNINASPGASEPPVAIISDIVGDPDRGEIPIDDDDDNDDEMDSAFEGNSSMAAQTVFASEFLENAVTRDTSLSPSMESALSSLRQIVSMQNRKRTNQDSRFPNAKPMPRGGMRELPMPPSPVVVGILRDIKNELPETFTLMCTFIAVDDFVDCCRRVYFATEDYSLATFIVVNAGLFYLFQEKATRADEAHQAEKLLEYRNLCRDNLETALMALPLFMPARKESIEALLLAASYAVEASRFTLAWQLNSSAVMICQTLGYHRLPATSSSGVTSANDDVSNDTKSALFWFAYMLDKGLSLRFGRSSMIQDYDIAIPKRMGRTINVADFWKEMLNLWIEHAEVMGKAYEQLYSIAALSRPPEQRIESARQLVEAIKGIARENDELIRHARETGKLADSGKRDGFTVTLMLQSDEVTYWASLCLIYRAIPAAPGFGSTFNPECIEAARRAVEVHLECMQIPGLSHFTKVGYLHWTILYAPFIPFIVLFCHVIETSNMQDLDRMDHFVASLSTVCSISEAIDKFNRVCQVLCHVARLYVETKAQQQQDQDMMLVGHDFDMYLSQLGFMPQQLLHDQQHQQQQHTNSGSNPAHQQRQHQHGNMAAPGAAAAVTPGVFGADIPAGLIDATQTAQLGNWFSGHRHIMNLVEEDLSGFEPRIWSTMTGGP